VSSVRQDWNNGQPNASLGHVRDLPMISNGHIAHHGTRATQSSFWSTMRSPDFTSACAYSQRRQDVPLVEFDAYSLRDRSSCAGIDGIADKDQTWP